MKKFDLIDKFAIIALLFFTLMFCATTYSQEKRIGFGTDNENIYGAWQSWDGSSVLYMNYNEDKDTFYRMSDTPDGREVAKGNFTLEEKYIYVQKENEELFCFEHVVTFRIGTTRKTLGMSYCLNKPVNIRGDA